MNLLDKIPPQAIDIEQAVLGSILLESDALIRVADILNVDLFYKESHRLIFQAIKKLQDNSEPIDILTVNDQLKEADQLESIGGSFAISQLISRVGSSANIVYHCQILIEKATARRVIKDCYELISRAYDDSCDILETVEAMGKSNEQISDSIYSAGSFKHISELLKESIKDANIRETHYKSGIVQGIPTGLRSLDNVLLGWQRGDLIILAARPGMGKTAMMLHHAVEAAMSGIPVCVFSMEMSAVSLSDRIVLAVSKVDSYSYKSGRMDSQEWEAIHQAVKKIEDLPIYIDPNPVVTMRYIRTKARVMKHKGQCGIVFIDYLQLCDMKADEKGRNREQEVSATSRMAKIIAKELDVPVILLSQLNRGVESRTDKRPGLADLRESGAIEQDADIVGFLYRPEYYMNDPIQKRELSGTGEYIIAKNRSGPTKIVMWGYNASLTDIHEFIEIPPEDTKPYLNFNEPNEEPF